MANQSTGKISTEELQEAFHASNLKYSGWGFLRALQTPAVCKSLELDAFARRQKAERAATEQVSA